MGFWGLAHPGCQPEALEGIEESQIRRRAIR